MTLDRGRHEFLDELEPLWLSLFDHHLAVGAAGLPTVARECSWPIRLALYERLLEGGDAFVLVVRRGTAAVGYAMVHVHEGADDTWPTGERIGEVETLVVLPSERGQGFGTLLLDAAEDGLARIGVEDIVLAVLVGNDGAERMYRRRGMVPAMTKMIRLRRG